MSSFPRRLPTDFENMPQNAARPAGNDPVVGVTPVAGDRGILPHVLRKLICSYSLSISPVFGIAVFL